FGVANSLALAIGAADLAGLLTGSFSGPLLVIQARTSRSSTRKNAGRQGGDESISRLDPPAGSRSRSGTLKMPVGIAASEPELASLLSVVLPGLCGVAICLTPQVIEACWCSRRIPDALAGTSRTGKQWQSGVPPGMDATAQNRLIPWV